MQKYPCLTLGEVAEQCEELIARLGVTLQVGSDFEIFKFFVGDSDRETPLDPIFSPVASDINEVKGIWLLGRNEAGDVVQTQAMRMLDLGAGTFAGFLENKISDIRPHGYDVDIAKTRWRLSQQATQISGDVCYHGGLWIRGDFRGGSLACLVTRYLMAKTILKLNPDYLVGLQAPFTACKGLSAREGYMRLEQRSILWQLKNREGTFEDWLVWMSREEAEFSLAVPPSEFFSMFEKQASPTRKTA